MEKPMTANRFPKAAIVAGYVLVIAYAIYLRTRFVPAFFGYPRMIIFDSDTARFLRLIDLISHYYPSLPMFDSFANFPWGMKEQLPPIWAFLETTFALLVGRAFQIPLFSAAAVFPVIVGMLFAVPAYYTGKRLFGSAVGHAGALVSLLYPTIVLRSALGMVDHHVADLFLYMSIITFVVGSHYHYSQGNNQRAGAMAVLAGFTLVLILLISLSSILVVFILAVTFLAGQLFLAEDERRFSFWIGTLTMASAGFVMLLLYFVTPWFDKDISFSALSLFQPVVLIGLAALMGASRGLDLLLSQRPLARALSLLGLYFIVAGTAFAIPVLGEKIVRGFYRSVGFYPLGRITMEQMPDFSDVPLRILAMFGAVMLGFFIWVRHIPLTRRLEFWRVLFLVWFTVAGLYCMNVRYYEYIFTPIVVLSLAAVVAKPPGPAKTSDGLGTDKRGLVFVAWALIPVSVSVLLILWPITKHWKAPDESQTLMLKWVKENTPGVSFYYTPTHRPEYGIASAWDIGEFIEFIAERPTLGTGNHETGIKGIVTSYRILQARSEDEAVVLMREHHLRYVLLDREYGPWVGDIERIGESGAEPDRIAHLATNKEIPKKDYYRLFNVRLYRHGGAGSKEDKIEPLQHFRLLKVTGVKENTHKFFELVNGARLSVKTAPGVKVLIVTRIRPEGAKVLEWKLTGTAGPDGIFRAYLPYATIGNRYPVKADPYRLVVGDKVSYVEVSEEDVLLGSAIRLSFPSQLQR